MMMPSIALPTGPYDWHDADMPRAFYEQRLAAFRAAMARAGVTHAIVHGNGFDHAALFWLTHFTPKLGPAYALVPARAPLRLLFAGGPGMRPSAQRLTWVADVVAVRGIEGDVKRWLADADVAAAPRAGLVEGTAMLRGDWRAVQRAAGGAALELDAAVDELRARSSEDEEPAREAARQAVRACRDRLSQLAAPGADVRAAAIEAERAAYAAGAQDVRWRIARRPGGAPTTMPDDVLPLTGPTAVVLAVRHSGAWCTELFVVSG